MWCSFGKILWIHILISHENKNTTSDCKGYFYKGRWAGWRNILDVKDNLWPLVGHKIQQIWGGKKKRREWEKTAVSLKFCNNARGCSVRHNSLPSTQCNSNWRNACAARYPMWSDSTWTEFKKKKKKGKAVQHYHRAVRQNTAMHLNIYRNWFRAGRTTTLDEVLLLRFQCRHAAVIL